MLIELKEIDYCNFEVNCALDVEQVQSKKDEIAQRFKDSSVPGFRPGKANLAAIKNHYRSSINDMAKSELCQTAYHSVLAEKNLKPFNNPQFTKAELAGNTFKCNFKLFTKPTIELAKYKGFDLPKGEVKDPNEIAAQILEKIRQMNGSTIPFTENDFVQHGDEVIINYQAYLDKEEKPVIDKDGEILTVGSAYIEAVNENLIGMKLGERREFSTVVPADSGVSVLANKDTKFVIELTMGSKKIPAALDDELAQKVGVKDINELTNVVNAESSNKSQELSRKHIFDQVSARLVESHDMKIPNWILDYEVKMIARQNNHDFDKLSDDQKKIFEDLAVKNLKLSFILDKIREEEPEAQMTDEEVIKVISLNIGKYKSIMQGMSEKTDNEALETLRSAGFMPAIIDHIKNDFTMDFIIKNSTIQE